MMGRTIKWGILGCGKIASKFAADMALVADAKLVAIGSRDIEQAEAFGERFDVERRYGSYEALVADADLDIIYVATPHSRHYNNTLLCLQHGKAVLCEKAFAINSRQAQEMVGLAKEKGLFLMEAMWTKFLPTYQKAMELLQQNVLGDIKNVLANFGFVAAKRNSVRLTDRVLGGGSLLDIGVYNAMIALSVLGRPDTVEASMTPSPEGVDEQCAVLFKYNNGAMAQLFSSFTTNLPNEANISGSAGRLRLSNMYHTPSALLEWHKSPGDVAQIPVEREKAYGYQFEARHVVDCLQKGLTESPLMTHANTLLLMETLDRIREAAGIVYDADVAGEDGGNLIYASPRSGF